MTQRELAERLQLSGWDISRSGIAKVETGLRKVTDVEVALLAEALGVHVAWLFDQTH
jgi:transcriptional regulator with XRE-family HTH domain